MPSPARRPVVQLFAIVLLSACGAGPSRLPPEPPAPSPAAPDSFLVRFETSQGPFVVAAHRDWSPLGVDRFYDLVRRRSWDDIVLFRVVKGFVVQFGIADDSLVNRAWRARGLPDEPVVESNRRGRVSFARGGPATRSQQVFINLADNPRLDTMSVGGVTGYPPLGEVAEGMEVVDRFKGDYGNAPAQSQDSITRLGNAWLDRTFPGLDRIQTARVIREWRSRRRGRGGR